jgi:succinate dehydrogenase flavin-adding protein (antitoxin of CptAB toxin-antitoxin module)
MEWDTENLLWEVVVETRAQPLALYTCWSRGCRENDPLVLLWAPLIIAAVLEDLKAVKITN